MKRLAMLALIGVAVAMVAGCGKAAPNHVGVGRDYDSANGFSIVPPAGMTKGQGPAGTFMLYMAPAKDNFAANMNVNAQPGGGGGDIAQAVPELKKVLAGILQNYAAVDDAIITISGRQAFRLSGTFTGNGMKLQNLQYGIVGGNNKVYTITFTCLQKDFAEARPTYDKCAMTALTD